MKQRKDSENKFVKAVEDKIILLRNEIISEARTRTENISNLN